MKLILAFIVCMCLLDTLLAIAIGGLMMILKFFAITFDFFLYTMAYF